MIETYRNTPNKYNWLISDFLSTYQHLSTNILFKVSISTAPKNLSSVIKKLIISDMTSLNSWDVLVFTYYIYTVFMYFMFPCISLCQEHFTRVVQEKRELKDYADRVTRELRRQRVGVLHWENLENPTRSWNGPIFSQTPPKRMKDNFPCTIVTKTTFLLIYVIGVLGGFRCS